MRLRFPLSHCAAGILFCGVLSLSACGDDETPAGTGSGAGSSVSSSSSSSTTGAGGMGGMGGEGGMGGAGGSSAGVILVGVGKRKINPTIVESEFVDSNMDGYWDPNNEAFTDVNGNGKFDASWMAGFGTGRPASGINDDLEVRAIAMQKDGKTVVVCILDAIGYFIDDMDAVRADPKVAALGVDHVLIGSTHVHEGVDTIGMWGPQDGVSGLNAEYQKLTRDMAAQAIEDAVKSMKPSRMRVAQVKTVDANGSAMAYVNDTRDPVIFDPTLTIAQFKDDADPTQTVATLVNWSAHPEYAGSGNRMISADYVHWLRDGIEMGVPDQGAAGIGGTTVFVQGALGGQVGPGGGVGPIGKDGMPITKYGLPRSEAVGTNVAALALKALAESGEDVTDTSVVHREKQIFAHVENIGYHFLHDLGVLQREFVNYDPAQPIGPGNIPELRSQIAYLQIGPMAMITSPGELHPELWVGVHEDGSWSFGKPILTEVQNAPALSMAPPPPFLRELMLANPGVKYPFVGGLVQDFVGYIVPSFNYVLDPNNPYLAEAPGDHYEETNSIGPQCEAEIQHPMMDLAKAP
jgi:hypothetical protein